MRLLASVRSLSVLVVAACVVLVLPSGVAAQQVGGGVKAGVTLGDIPNASEMFPSTGVSTSRSVGYAAGAFALVQGKSGLGFQPEVLYTQKGITVDVTGGGVVGKVQFKVDYVDIPLLVRYTFGKGAHGYIFGGPSVDFRVRAKEKITTDGSSEEDDMSSDVERFEFAVTFGGGVEVGPILLEARWSEGLTNIDKSPATDAPSLKTRTFLFLGGVRF